MTQAPLVILGYNIALDSYTMRCGHCQGLHVIQGMARARLSAGRKEPQTVVCRCGNTSTIPPHRKG